MKFIYIVGILFFLAGCQKEFTYDYLITHPQFLQKEYEKCENTERPECETIRRVAMDFSATVRHQMQDPDRFGREVMEAQHQLLELKAAYQKDPTPDSKQAYVDQKQKLDRLYAVIALRTPE
ncbi:MAG TPA: EexN family lipoprotein [Gammaproteobacteria bacterium]|jgi:hypothetical protein|nr:EexN family lipoprotein [Gammaproteobacteria bacterium]